MKPRPSANFLYFAAIGQFTRGQFAPVGSNSVLHAASNKYVGYPTTVAGQNEIGAVYSSKEKKFVLAYPIPFEKLATDIRNVQLRAQAPCIQSTPVLFQRQYGAEAKEQLKKFQSYKPSGVTQPIPNLFSFNENITVIHPIEKKGKNGKSDFMLIVQRGHNTYLMDPTGKNGQAIADMLNQPVHMIPQKPRHCSSYESYHRVLAAMGATIGVKKNFKTSAELAADNVADRIAGQHRVQVRNQNTVSGNWQWMDKRGGRETVCLQSLPEINDNLDVKGKQKEVVPQAPSAPAKRMAM